MSLLKDCQFDVTDVVKGQKSRLRARWPILHKNWACASVQAHANTFFWRRF